MLEHGLFDLRPPGTSDRVWADWLTDGMFAFGVRLRMKPTKRVDPKSRPPSGRRPWDQVENRDPNRHYVFANPNSQDTGVDYYLSIGYEVVKYSVDGPRPKVFRTLKDGDAVTCMGQVLMSIPLDEKQSMDAEMMVNVDAIERKMIRSGGIADSMRGSAGQAKFVPDTSESFAE